MSTPSSQFIHPHVPLGIHMFVLHVCVSIPVLQIRSSIPFLWEKAMATHSSVLAWRIPWMGEPGGLPSLGSYRVGHDWSGLAAAAQDHKKLHTTEQLSMHAPICTEPGEELKKIYRCYVVILLEKVEKPIWNVELHYQKQSKRNQNILEDIVRDKDVEVNGRRKKNIKI